MFSTRKPNEDNDLGGLGSGFHRDGGVGGGSERDREVRDWSLASRILTKSPVLILTSPNSLF